MAENRRRTGTEGQADDVDTNRQGGQQVGAKRGGGQMKKWARGGGGGGELAKKKKKKEEEEKCSLSVSNVSRCTSICF